MISERAKNIAENIYVYYGSDSGFLFGIPPEYREAVKAVIQVTIDMLRQEDEKCTKCGGSGQVPSGLGPAGGLPLAPCLACKGTGIKPKDSQNE